MTKWATDCNRDGVIDCYDFAAIHKTGAAGCSNQWLYESAYWNKLRKCLLSSNPIASGTPVRKPPNNPGRVQERPISRPQIAPEERPIRRPQIAPEERPIRRPQFAPEERPIRRPQIVPETRPQEFPRETAPVIPGRAPLNPVSWATTRHPSHSRVTAVRPPSNDNFGSFGQPFVPNLVSQPPNVVPVKPVDVSEETSIVKPLNPSSPNNPENNRATSFAPANGPVEESCLECLCAASSDCDLNKKCEGNE